ncbi:MAG: methylase [Lachnospiraceae bacterium]|nr:methylase [Lachnospiraceae bacterium]
MHESEKRSAAAAFAGYWKGKGDEKGESQKFWLSLLKDVLGVEHPEQFIRFEDRVFLGHTSFIDAYIPETKVLIEQKKLGKDLREPVRQSDGTLLTPFSQAKRYAAELPYSQRPRWIVTCNFSTFHVYDMELPGGDPEVIELENLEKEYYRLNFLVDSGNENLKREMEVSVAAGELVGVLYDALLKEYKNPTNPESLRSLNKLCVRIVFCLYAEDAGIFGNRTMFHDYMEAFDARSSRKALIELFRVLDEKPEERDPYLDEALAAFPYVNGGLFSDEQIEIPNFTDEIRRIILSKASEDFDWSEISPTIFGAVFESTLNPETRRCGGMHYTSIENIHKVIDPLFLDSLKEEFENIKSTAVEKTKKQNLHTFQDKLASFKFLDPACGSGNFLTEAFLSIRRLENAVLNELQDGQITLGDVINPVKCSIRQFYGIEINDFAVTVAKTALWIAESQMLKETESIVHKHLDFLPLKTNAHIVEGNALRMDWTLLHDKTVIPVIRAKKAHLITYGDALKKGILSETGEVRESPFDYTLKGKYDEINLIVDEMDMEEPVPAVEEVHYDYIMGNPPFVGYSFQSREQKEDILSVYLDENGRSYKTAGKMDYVAGWYYKAAKLMQGTNVKTAFVSTNSITQGEQVASIWKPLYELFGIHIDFAYKTFRWDSESSSKAHVHCVIVGFSCDIVPEKRKIYTSERFNYVENINPYLIDAPDIFIESRKQPLGDVPEMTTGNRPADGGNLIIEADEYDDFICREPESRKYIKRLVGSEEFINNKKRYCLWLVGVSPTQLRSMPLVMKRVEACRADRQKGAPDRQKLADTPMLFRETKNPDMCIIVPATSSEKRRYVPIGFLDNSTITTNSCLIIPNATLYHFGILTSNVHMAWMRTVAGRLKSDYRYSKEIVYNNFPWPEPNDAQKVEIEAAAQMILTVRAKYPDCSLADLYDDIAMPPDLRKAHQENDKAVMRAYGFSIRDTTEAGCVGELMKLYRMKADSKHTNSSMLYSEDKEKNVK